MRIFVGAYDRLGGRGVGEVFLSGDGARIDRIEWEGSAPDPSYLTANRAGTRLYAACEADLSQVAAWDIVDGLRFLGAQPAPGQAVCHVCLSPDERFLYAAGYMSGTVHVFPVTDAGLGPCAQTVTNTGHGEDPARQEASHAHCVSFTPDGRFLCLCDLGLDAVILYDWDRETGRLTEASRTLFSGGLGARHIAFGGEYAFVVHEMGNAVSRLSWKAGTLKRDMTWKVLPDEWRDRSTCAAIRVLGEKVYVSNRGRDTVSVFGFDGSALGEWSSGGHCPRDILPLDGRRMLCANQESGSLALICPEDGTVLDTAIAPGAVGLALTAGGQGAPCAEAGSGVALPTREKRAGCAGPGEKKRCPAFKASGLFSSHMVLQRDEPISVWGFSDAPGSEVAGEFMGHTARTRVRADNGWRLTFPPAGCAREPQAMRLWDDRGNEALFEDVLVGDVWVIGGQSNAELTLQPCMCETPDVTFSGEENFRLFTQTQRFVAENMALCAEPQRDIVNLEWRWKRPDREASLEFSAMGWYFAREVSGKIDAPLGMVMAAAGGACLRELIPEALAHAEGYFEGAGVPVAGYYNTLIHPLLGLRFRGMLFFQGESEGGEKALADSYREDLSLLVYDERKSFGFDFPFYNVQISNYPGEGDQYFPYHDIVRVQQTEALGTIPDSALAVSMDLGSPEGYPDWAHSPKKRELAHRLALLALAREYGVGREEEASSPLPVKAALSEDGREIRVTFRNTAEGLRIRGLSAEESRGRDLPGFCVGPYEARVPARARILDGETVAVRAPEGADASRVGYSFFLKVSPESSNLVNSVGLPCPAFHIPVEG